MRYFIDSSDISAIERCLETGLIDGVTTNPTLVRKSGKHPYQLYRELCDLQIKDISMEVSGDYKQMHSEALHLKDVFGAPVTIKLPMTREGLQVCRVLSVEKIRTNVTLIFNIAQALLAAKAGATYVSPFVGRIDDQGYAGLEVVRGIADAFRTTGQGTQVLAASIRTPQRAIRSVCNGADVVTMPPQVFDAMYSHVLTTQGLEIFEADLKASAL